jgi:hypothetical protein
VCYLDVSGEWAQDKAEYMVIATSGQIVNRQAITSATTAIDISGFAKGVYLVTILRDNRIIYRQKLMIK